MAGTQGRDYTDRLINRTSARWKRLLGVQLPYRWHVRRICHGRVLDVGCGVGRNLAHLGGRAVGVDHNPTSVAEARARGYEAYTVDQFAAPTGSFDTLLVAHVLEHLEEHDARGLMDRFAGYVRPGGRIVLITPQERGFASEDTHIRWTDLDELSSLCRRVGATPTKRYSFPLPRRAGRLFTYNEFVLIASL